MPVDAAVSETGAVRVLPDVTKRDSPYWTQGRHGALVIPMCPDCRRWSYPELSARCTACGAPTVSARLRGVGTVHTFTVNRHRYHPQVAPPNIIALIQPVEDPTLHLIAGVVDCAPDDMRIGLEVEVDFERHDGAFVPVFRPRRTGTD